MTSTHTGLQTCDIPYTSGEFMEGCNTMQTEDTIVETDLLDMPWAGDAEEPIPSE